MRKHAKHGSRIARSNELCFSKGGFQKSLNLKCSPEALKNLANLLKDQGYIDDAKQCFEKSLELRPDFSEALYDLPPLLNGT